MSQFGRAFPVEQITPAVLDANSWLKDMLALWSPAGAKHASGSDRHLRLAIRNGYLSFYRCGQSIAKVEFGSKGLRAFIHNKYIYGERGNGNGYVSLNRNGFTNNDGVGPQKYESPDDLGRWIANVNGKHIGEEKRFVDSVLTCNPNVVDLEMALPAYSLVREERTAPRMDVVALEPFENHWRIVFWEAKLAEDGRIKRRGAESPEVFNQLSHYTSWLDQPGHCDRVCRAYQEACRILVALQAIENRVELGPGIIAAAADGAPAPLIDKQPRLLIYDETGRDSFKSHLEKLQNHSSQYHVQVIKKDGDMALDIRS